MSRNDKVKQEIKILTEAFPTDHACCHLKQGCDELTCIFRINDENSHKFTVNILNYPETAPVWFTESDEAILEEVLESLASNECQTLTGQMKSLLTELCRIHHLQLPSELSQLDVPEYSLDALHDDDSLESDYDEACADNNNDVLFEDNSKATEALETDDLSDEQLKLLSNIKTKINDKSKTSSSSILASNRLRKELQNIFKSDGYKNKSFTVDLVDDLLYQWHVRLLLSSIDSDSPLYEDLVKLKNEKGVEGILLHFVFSDNFPFDPPIVRVVEPAIDKGHVFDYGGVMCMELLLKQGWSSAYTIEAVILQVAATLVRGKGRVSFAELDNKYTLSQAREGLKMLERLPDKDRWTSSFKDG